MNEALAAYDDLVAGKATNPVDTEGTCPKGGSVRITGGFTALADGSTALELTYLFKGCATAARDYAFTFDGSVQMKGSIGGSASNGATDFTFSADALSISGNVAGVEDSKIAETCPVTVHFQSQPQGQKHLDGSICGRAFGTPVTGTGGAGGSGGGGGVGGSGGGQGDPCAPYSGSYAGIYAFSWTCVNDPSLNGSGTINVHFSAKCAFTKPDGTLWLYVTSVMSDNAHLGSLTQESCPVDCGWMAMPPNPPATSGADHTINIVFPNLAILSTEGPFTVTTGALKLGSDVGNDQAFVVGEPAFTSAGKPTGCVIDKRTFKIDKTSL